MKHIISVGGGISSTLMLPIYVRYIMNVPKEDVVLLTAVLPNEDQDVFRLVNAVESLLDIPVTRISDGRTPLQVFMDVKFLGNSRIDPCSRILKRELLRSYIKANFAPDECVIHVGIGKTEIDREMSIRRSWKEAGYRVDFPLDELDMTREYQMRLCYDFVGFVPRLYQMGFSHNNCGGACIKAGKKDWARLLFFLPEVYAYWEEGEKEFREKVGDYTILKEMRKGVIYHITLESFRLTM